MCRERRSSRRSVKNRIVGKSSASKTTDEGSKSRTKDASANANKSLANITSTNEFCHPKVFARPNRRFPGLVRTIKRDIKAESESAPDGSKRIYSSTSTSGKVYLAKIPNHDHDPLKPIKLDATLPPLKYPAMHNFLTKKGFRSILVLQNYELRKLARLGGKMAVNGFNPLSKSNPAVWPYPCSRPFFKTCWLFRALNARTLANVALQVRILWCSLRWDDMTTKPPTSNGKIVNNTDTGIVSMELLKHRIRGRFSEKTEYLRLTLLIPYGYADPQPNRGKWKTRNHSFWAFFSQSVNFFFSFFKYSVDTSENTPSRSGLRKRKRPETPQKTEKQVNEEWVDEDQLQLWEIKLFGER